jgi:hypothetical protein
MPTPRKSLRELLESGTLQKNIGRYQARIAAVANVISPIGRAPNHLTAPEKAIWAELVKTAPPGLLMKNDRLIVEVAVKLVHRMRTSEPKSSEINALATVLSKLGMNPTDRVKMNLEPPIDPSVQTEEDRRWAALDDLD